MLLNLDMLVHAGAATGAGRAYLEQQRVDVVLGRKRVEGVGTLCEHHVLHVRVVPRREPAVRPVVLQQLVEVVEEVRDRGVHVAERAVQRGDALGLDGGFRGERGGGVGGEAYCAEKEREEERAEGRERGGG